MFVSEEDARSAVALHALIHGFFDLVRILVNLTFEDALKAATSRIDSYDRLMNALWKSGMPEPEFSFPETPRSKQ